MGLPAKARYRRFRIKTVEGIDDPRMMAEAVRRRYQRLLKEKGVLPDLLLMMAVLRSCARRVKRWMHWVLSNFLR